LETAGRWRKQMGTGDKIRHYADDEIDMSYDAPRCIHAAECVDRPEGVRPLSPALDPAYRCPR
jgi:hypothetical protein